MELTGTFQITDWQETIEREFDEGAKLSIALVQQIYTGDIIGSSNVRYQLYYNKSGDAVFNGFETIILKQENEDVLLTLKHDGKFEIGTASSKFTVIDSSHNTNLSGKKGSFKSIEGGKANYQIL